jgi:hypothetical protein
MKVYFVAEATRVPGQELAQPPHRFFLAHGKGKNFPSDYFRDQAAYVFIIARYTNPY